MGGGGGGVLSYISYIGMCRPKEYAGMKTDAAFDHLDLESRMVFKGTTRAYKRMEDGMFWSEIGSGFKKPGGTLPPRIPRSTPPPRTELPLSNISFDTHARINEIKNCPSKAEDDLLLVVINYSIFLAN